MWCRSAGLPSYLRLLRDNEEEEGFDTSPEDFHRGVLAEFVHQGNRVRRSPFFDVLKIEVNHALV